MDDTQIEMLPMLGEFSSIASQYEHIMFYYESGIQQIVAKLQILNNEFKNNHERNPIENIKSRVKSLDSIIDKMKRKGIPLTTNAMKREIKDIAGVRVICPFISDVYQVANMLVNQADVEIVTIKDYIKKPKENGYRSLHMIVLVDVLFSDRQGQGADRDTVSYHCHEFLGQHRASAPLQEEPYIHGGDAAGAQEMRRYHGRR